MQNAKYTENQTYLFEHLTLATANWSLLKLSNVLVKVENLANARVLSTLTKSFRVSLTAIAW